MKTPRRTKLWPVLIGAALIAIAIAATLVVFQSSAPEDQSLAPAKQPESQQDKPKPTEKMLELPNAQPIQFIDGDYQSDDHLWRMVNKSKPLQNKHYRPDKLAVVEPSRTDKSADERSVRSDILPAAHELFAAAQKDNIDLMLGSGFRDYDLQNLYYTNYARNYGQAAADTFSAKPGHSEHQTGLTMDLATLDRKCYLEECFAGTPAGKWLAKNAYLYGFILRYPNDKPGVTDFIFEPWHYRYVGKDLAKALHDSGLTLEEAWPYMTASRS